MSFRVKVKSIGIMTLALLLYSYYAKANQIVIDRIVASIEGVGVITNVQLVQYAAITAVLDSGYNKAIEELKDPQYMRTSLDKLINRTLMLKDAQLLSLNKPGQQQIEDLIKQFKMKFNSETELEKFLKYYGITNNYLEKFMSDTLIVNQYLNDEVRVLIKVSNKDIEQYYKDNINAYKEMNKQDAEKSIKILLEQQAYDKQLKSWIKTLSLNRQIIIMY